MDKKKNTLARRLLRAVLVFALWVGVWQLAYGWVGQEILLASPLQVASRLAALAATGDFWLSILSSMGRVLLGYALALAAGCLLAAFTCAFSWADAFFRPVLHLIRATPVASFIILALVWLATGQVPVFTSFLMVLPLVWANVSQGIRRMDPMLLEMARVYRLGRAKRLLRLVIPSLMPYFLAAATTGVGLAWKAGIAAEVLCRPELSMGKALYNAKIYLETPDLFAWTAAIILLSVLLEKGLVWLIRRAGRRYNVQNEEG